jgi:hypothetical protein
MRNSIHEAAFRPAGGRPLPRSSAHEPAACAQRAAGTEANLLGAQSDLRTGPGQYGQHHREVRRRPARERGPTRRALALLALPLLLACSDNGSEPDARPNVTGTWSGSVGTGAGTMTLTHNTSTGQITGNGSISAGVSALAITVQGTYARPTVSLTVSSPGYEPFNFTGTHSGNSITGVINGSGFVNTGVTLSKQ